MLHFLKMGIEMKISIIVPVYNAERYLRNCLDAIQIQSYKDIEILLVNDGSTDCSESICMEYVRKDYRFRYYKINNHGVSYARNYGINRATGEYLCFVDADDFICNDFCKELITNMTSYDCDLSVCGYIETEILMNLNVDSNSLTEVVCDDKVFWLINKYEGFLCNKMYKTDIIVANNLKIDEDLFMCEDLIFNLAYLEFVDKIIYTNDVLYGYLIHQNNASRAINDKWFSVLSAVSKAYEKIEQYSARNQTAIAWFVINLCFEVKVRCRMLEKSFNELLDRYDIGFYEIKRRYKWKILLDEKISMKKKLKLIAFDSFFPVAEMIKVYKMLKGI